MAQEQTFQQLYIQYLDFCDKHNMIPMYDITDYICEFMSAHIIYDCADWWNTLVYF